MDKVYIHGLEVETVIGIYPWERIARQRLVLDLEMDCDIAAAAASEDISHTLNYKAISDRILAYVREHELQLVETLAERLAQMVLEDFPVQALRLKLAKPGAVSEAREVGVVIERCREEQA